MSTKTHTEMSESLRGLYSENPQVRNRAQADVRTLLDGDPCLLALYGDLFRSRSCGKRYWAVQKISDAVAKANDKSLAVQLCLNFIERDPCLRVRAVAARTIGYFDSHALVALEPLIEVLESLERFPKSGGSTIASTS